MLSLSTADCAYNSGRCYTKPVLRELMVFCERNKIHLVSDEVYGLSVYDESVKFTSVLSLDTTDLIDLNRLHVLYGMSKVSLCIVR